MGGHTQRLTIEIPSSLDLISVARMTIMNAVEAVDALTGDRLDDLRLAISEAVTNAVRANLETNPAASVTIDVDLEPGRVKLVVIDKGPGMPEPEDLPPLTDPSRLTIEGGFGVPLMRSLADDHFEFDSTPKGTTVRIWLLQ